MVHRKTRSYNGLMFLAQAFSFCAVFVAVQNTTVPLVGQTLPYLQMLGHPIHGERCDPKTDGQMFPIGDALASDKFLYCHREKRVYDIGFCVGNSFDPIKRKCIAKTTTKIHVEEGETTTNGAPMTTKRVYSAAKMPTFLKIFAKATKQRKVPSSEMTGQRIREFLPENTEAGIGTNIKTRIANSSKNAIEANVQKLAQNDDKKRDEILKDGREMKILIKMRRNSSENVEEFGKKDNEFTESMGQRNAKNGKSQIEIEESKVRHFVVCSDGSLPFGDNNGHSHRCFPDHGHNPFSSFACPFSYRCEFSSVLRTHQCCPELVEKAKIFEDENWAENGEGTTGEQHGERRPNLDFDGACPAAHFLRIHPKNGQPTLCSPSWLILTGHGGCPPFSKCIYSPPLLQFVCCQPNNLLKAMENELKIQSYALYPALGIFPAQSGCIGDGQCQVRFPGAKCQNWVCICPQGLSAYKGRCVINCPNGYSADLNGICTTKEAFEQKVQKHPAFLQGND
ncbi:hypothetical protein niasHS_005818 [Heterodera schachtii]|uniref:Chitin-binding type-2 domain-containing protein n=1 Tax=Heterodera schachtii TaxID=97005 RepID=A0ABD2JZI4_HETSC